MMGFSKKVVFIIAGFILLLIGCKNEVKNNNILGNWKSVQTEDGPDFRTELFMDEETFNVFSEEFYDIAYSKKYELTTKEILIFESDKERIPMRFTYKLSGDTLIISGGELSTVYTKILRSKTMDKYINGIIPKKEYIDAFNNK